jgi:DNA-binding NarL/FixJ family response regulator
MSGLVAKITWQYHVKGISFFLYLKYSEGIVIYTLFRMGLNILPKIAVVEGNCFYRSGLCLSIQSYNFVELVFEVSRGTDFVDRQLKTPSDIAIMDDTFPIKDGFKVIQEIKKDFPQLKIIILTTLDRVETIHQNLAESVQGYLLKNIDDKVLEKALKAVIRGQECYSKELIDFFTQLRKENSIKSKNKGNLTRQELTILQLIFEGYTNQEIADKLFISIRTVTNHRFSVHTKTGTKNTAGLISHGLKNKLIHFEYNSTPVNKCLYL